jgi:endonuclease/exonuclease/phosphatase family metal-dependent hydrolase
MNERFGHAVWWATAALTVATGLPLLRVFMATTNFYLVDARAVPPVVGGGLALGVFVIGSGLPFLASTDRRWRKGLSAGGITLGISRVVEQIVQAPGYDLAVASIGVAAFLFVLVQLTVASAAFVGMGVLVGFSLDVALLGAMRTLDLSWLDGAVPIVLGSLLAAGLVAGGLTCAARGRVGGPGGYGAVLGPWLVLQMIVFGNLGFFGSVTGSSLPAASMIVAAGGAVAVAVASYRWPAGWSALGWGALLTGSAAVLATSRGPGVALALLTGQTAAAGLATVALRRDTSTKPAGVAAGLLATVVLLFFYYGSYEFDLRFRSSLILVLCAVSLALVGIGAAQGKTRPITTRAPAATPSALVVPAVALWLLWSPPAHVATEGIDEVRIMSYNLHQGFNTAGRLDIEALATVIESEAADIVALQEVSRGWVVNGSLDVLSWLSDRLGMPFVSGPTADGQWGNAVLSRYAIAEWRNIPLPPDDLPLRRGYLDVVVDLGGENLRVIATHLHHVPAHDEVRNRQADVLVAAWDGSPRTVLLGDLNATPDSMAIHKLKEAGFVDAGRADGVARPTSPADDPLVTIDYILISPDLAPREISVMETQASDHLPVAVTLTLVR